MKLSRVNNILLTLIILVNGYIVLAPLLPVVSFWWEDRGGTRQAELTHRLHPSKEAVKTNESTELKQNSLIIPAMLLDQPIHEGPVSQRYNILNDGIWRWPASSTPDKGGNTVLLGHRFTYTQPKGVLYYLDKVKVGDEIGVDWQNRMYTYKVHTIREVSPSETSIQDQTSDARLTIYTCTPLWLPKHRLVITASLEEKS